MNVSFSFALIFRNLPDFRLQRKAKTLLNYVFIIILFLCFYTVLFVIYHFVFRLQRYKFFLNQQRKKRAAPLERGAALNPLEQRIYCITCSLASLVNALLLLELHRLAFAIGGNGGLGDYDVAQNIFSHMAKNIAAAHKNQ